MMKETEIVEAKVYLVKQHAVVAYSMIDEDIGSLAYYPIESGSFIKIERRSWETDNGTHESVEHLLCSGSEKILLLESLSDKGIKADKKVIRELSRLANLPIR
jgi:hypothetical protein